MPKYSDKKGKDAKHVRQPDPEQHNRGENHKVHSAQEGSENSHSFDDKRLREHAARKAKHSSRSVGGYTGL